MRTMIRRVWWLAWAGVAMACQSSSDGDTAEKATNPPSLPDTGSATGTAPVPETGTTAQRSDNASTDEQMPPSDTEGASDNADTARPDTDGRTDTEIAGTGTESDAPSGPGSPGCGRVDHLRSGTWTLAVDGVTRTFILDVPADYDAHTPAPLFFTWHWLGGSAQDVVHTDYYGLRSRAPSAIFAAPQGLQNNGSTGWWNNDDQDIDFFDALFTHLTEGLCIDTNKVFSTGFSFGGMMSNLLGCRRSAVLRAIAPMSGMLWGSCGDEGARVAYLGIHGDADDVVNVAAGRSARDVFVARNQCSGETQPAEAPFPSPCMAYTGCADGYPVLWCEFSGGHAIWQSAGAVLWSFFSAF